MRGYRFCLGYVEKSMVLGKHTNRGTLFNPTVATDNLSRK